MAKGVKFAAECASIDVSQNFFSQINCEIFSAKNQKTFSFGKIRKHDGEKLIWKKNALFFLYGILNEMGSRKVGWLFWLWKQHSRRAWGKLRGIDSLNGRKMYKFPDTFYLLNQFILSFHSCKFSVSCKGIWYSWNFQNILPYS